MGNKTKTRYVSWRGRVWKALADAAPQQFVSADVRSYGYNRTGGDNPKYRLLIKSGINACNAMTVTVSNAEAEDYKTKVFVRKSANPGSPDYYKIGTFGNEGVFLNVNLPLGISSHSGSSSMGEACALAIRVLNRKITARRRQFQGVVALGELGKTAMMVLKPAKSLRAKAESFTRRVRKLTKRGAGGGSVAKVIADTWLEAQFGWKPLLADVQDGALAVARTAQKDVLERQQFRAYGENVVPSLTSESFVGPVGFDAGSGVLYRVNRIVKNTSACILYGRFSTKIQNPERVGHYATRLANLSGFNWEDVVPQAWELMPWSFLVDYFTNVGDVLEGCANLISGVDWIEEVHITETEDLRNYTIDVSALKANLGGTYVTHEGLDTHTKQSYKSISRHSFAGFLQPSLRFSLPVDLQWLNIAALIAGGKSQQAFSKR